IWSANILAAVIFGLGHLPTAIAIGIPLTALFVTRTVVLNGIGGVAFGWLYWKQGLESAMMAHFTVDIVLHVLFVLILSLL
ncbi:MAG: CPBP family intramembrane metalloprotease, partial [Theionarchaea archaeon]|nr:CPBP family intramembrane metalloprotease [Theionarchaea archaeon]